jgi:hypothetical protein
MPLPQPGSELDKEHPNQRTNQFAIPFRVPQRVELGYFHQPGEGVAWIRAIGL